MGGMSNDRFYPVTYGCELGNRFTRRRFSNCKGLPDWQYNGRSSYRATPLWQGLYDLCIFLQEHKSIYPCEESDGNSNVVSGRSDDICPAVPDYDELAAHQSHYVVLGNPFVIMIVKLRTIRIVVHLVHRLSILAGKFHQVFLPPCPLSFL